MNKRAQAINTLGTIVVGFVIAGVIMTVASKVLVDVQNTLGGNSTAGYQTTQWLSAQNATHMLGNVATNLPLIGTIVALSIVIAFVVGLKSAD